MVKNYVNLINYKKYVTYVCCRVVFVQYPITREIVQLRRADLKTKLNRVIYARAINAA